MLRSSRICSRVASILLLAILGVVTPGIASADDATYRVNTEASRIFVRVEADSRLGHNHGIEGKLSSGQVHFGGSGQFVFNINSFVADTPAARKFVGLEEKVSSADARKVTATMLGSEVLDASRYPTASFSMTSVKPLDNQAPGQPGRYLLDGQFLLHKTSRHIRIVAKTEPTSTPGVLRMHGQFTIVQSEYGIKPYSTFGGLVGVKDELTIWGEIYLAASDGR